jgi:hypothetical protein
VENSRALVNPSRLPPQDYFFFRIALIVAAIALTKPTSQPTSQ